MWDGFLPKGLSCLLSLIGALPSSLTVSRMQGCVGAVVALSVWHVGKKGIVVKLELAGFCCNWHVNMFDLVFKSGTTNTDEHAEFIHV